MHTASLFEAELSHLKNAGSATCFLCPMACQEDQEDSTYMEKYFEKDKYIASLCLLYVTSCPFLMLCLTLLKF